MLLDVGNTDYPGGGTNTHTALQYVRENCFTSAKGMRPNAVQIAVVVTDGQSYEPGITAIEAERLRNNVRETRCFLWRGLRVDRFIEDFLKVQSTMSVDLRA